MIICKPLYTNLYPDYYKKAHPDISISSSCDQFTLIQNQLINRATVTRSTSSSTELYFDEAPFPKE